MDANAKSMSVTKRWSSHVKRISESLGAEIHPDISWTSSLNTPPPSTLILPKPDESPCPVSLSEERNVVVITMEVMIIQKVLITLRAPVIGNKSYRMLLRTKNFAALWQVFWKEQKMSSQTLVQH
ncbi:hypothetical protein D4764_12G0003450 [Takifugu flavidus]|uniref:Uncharacterized protein n=1 Tax=Takifugu flavidus TaxID=433684 RepID=A0A5C6PC36_9TELE|nr:hypothetical protein D4764_12G0003450 [Takifugu flavidus]